MTEVQFLHERDIVTIYGDTLTTPKPIFGIDFENESLTWMALKLRSLVLKKEKKEERRSLWTLLLIATTT